MVQLNNKKILFIYGHGGMESLTLQIAKELEKRWNARSFFFGGSQGGDQYLIKKGIPKENIYLANYSDNKKYFPKPDIEFIKKAENKYGFNSWDVWQISAPRKKSRLKFSSDRVLYWVEYYIRETENCLNKFKPDYVLFYGIASFAGVITYKMLLNRNISILEVVNSRIPNRFTINNNLENRWPLLVEEYRLLQLRELSPEEIDYAENFIASFHKNEFRPDGVGKIKSSYQQKVKKYWSYLKTLRYRKQLPNLSQFLWPGANKVVDWSGTFQMPLLGEKYVYYPLHVNPEASTSIYGKWYVNQLALIENIARSIPCNYKLYVKEHPFNYSSRPFYFRKEIKKYPNVRLISPHANSVKLIKNSSLVLTITGTSGWEAIMLQKPLITFGDAYFNVFDKVTRVKDIRNLPALIMEHLDLKIDKNATLKFITAIFNSTFEGMGVMPGNCEKSLEADNISLIVDGIEQYVKRIEEKHNATSN